MVAGWWSVGYGLISHHDSRYFGIVGGWSMKKTLVCSMGIHFPMASELNRIVIKGDDRHQRQG